MSKYITFPVILLKGGLIDIKEQLNSVLNYSLYATSTTMTGTQDERIEKARKELGIKFSDIDYSYRNGEVIFDSLPDRTPKTSITKKMIFDFYKNYKTEFEVVTFLAFAAIRYILKQQAYIKMPNDYLVGRMSGNNKQGEPICEELMKYNNRYQLDKIKKELQLNWGLKLYASHIRGSYVSFTMPLEKLIYQAELKRKNYKLKQLQQAKQDAKKAAIDTIYGNST